jgi:GT2 family glycosyltransferase
MEPNAMNPSADAPTFAAIVANWNGQAFIERALGSLLAATRRAGRPIEAIVHDDASADDSPQTIARAFPTVRLERDAVNVGYGEAVNRAMRACQADWVFLLNNDLALAADFCERLLATLEERAAEAPFVIGARTLDWETGQANHGGQRAAWRGGMIVQEAFEADVATPTDFFQAGACLIDRRRFLELGGFSPLFHPGYWEDYDLAWRARGRGWTVFYEPRAVAYHLGKGSMRRLLGPRGVSLALRRNHLLFNWINIREPGRLAAHLAGLAALVATDRPGPDEASWAGALVAALGRLPSALAERRRRLPFLPPGP